MAGSIKVSDDDSELFLNLFTEGPFEELATRCDVITAASLVGSSKLFLDSAKDSATLSTSLPFGLPCILHSYPTGIPTDSMYLRNGDCLLPFKLTPLDRFSSNAVIPYVAYKQWAVANGDWIATVATKCKWHLVNVYTRRQIPLSAVSFKANVDPHVFLLDNGSSAVLQKIAICQVPTAAGRYKDFFRVVVFDIVIAILHGNDAGWTFLLPHRSLKYYLYSDAIMYNGLVFATALFGTVHVWDPLHPGDALVLSRPDGVDELVDAISYDLNDDLGENTRIFGQWWLARSPDGYRLLQIKTLGTVDEEEAHRCVFCATAAAHSGNNHCGRTVTTYASGFGCLVFSMDTSQLDPANPWEMITDLGAYSVFLGVNYPIILPVGDADLAPGYLKRSNCAYTSVNAAWRSNVLRHEICRFSLNGKDTAVGFQTNVPVKRDTYIVRSVLVKTPLWFIPSFANALDWNRTHVYD